MSEPFETLELPHAGLRSPAIACGLAANPDAPVVICLHGFPDHPRSFRFQLPVLARAGYRAIAPTLRGYATSNQPRDGDYSLVTLARDVVEWIDALQVERVHLVGHDWGAAIAYAAGALAPERFHTLATIAVPHAARLAEGLRAVPGQLRKSWYMGFFQLRGIAEWAVERNDWALIQRLWRDWSPGYSLPEAEWDALRACFEQPGVKRAMLAYYRQNASPRSILGGKGSEAMRLTRVPVPTLAITGSDDGCMDTALYDHVFHDEDFPCGFEVARIEKAGHFVHLEMPEVIDRLLLDWFDAATTTTRRS